MATTEEQHDNDDKDKRIRALEAQVQLLEDENRRLRENKSSKKASPVLGAACCDQQKQQQQQQEEDLVPQQQEESDTTSSTISQQLPNSDVALTKDEVERYSRQLLMSSNMLGGVPGQIRLRNSRVVVVGAGGIGSTVLLYLAAAGVGHLTVVDFDVVETSNLHRQIIHSTATVGQSKAHSARRAVLALNPMIQCAAAETAVTVDTVQDLIQHADCVVDASDNPATRYLLNDACYFVSQQQRRRQRPPLPLVSGSAVGTEGQCTVYHYNNNTNNNTNGCYRCMYPKQSTASCQSCSDAGVLGPVPGLVGILQAVEVLKILTATSNTITAANNDAATANILTDHLLLYDAAQAQFWRWKKPPRQAATCALCGDQPTIRSLDDTRTSLATVRGPATAQCRACPEPQAWDVSCREYYDRQQQQGAASSEPHLLLDVRVPAQFALCHLPRAVNLPLRDIVEDVDQVRKLIDSDNNNNDNNTDFPIYCVCRRGIASVTAAQLLRAHGWTRVYNLRQGLDAWRRDVDPSFPKY